MKKTKIFTKTFIYTLSLMLFIVVIAHVLIYFLSPHMQVNYQPAGNGAGTDYYLNIAFNPALFIVQSIQKALPISFACCFLISVVCSFFFSRVITVPIKHISSVTEQMTRLNKTAYCIVDTNDEIGVLADNINVLYHGLLSTIENLEVEKKRVSEVEKSKIDFLRSASHELKTPVTALNATLENMILGIQSYQDYDTRLPECKELVEQISKMIHDILETSKIGVAKEKEPFSIIDISELITTICEPYELIAKAHNIIFKMDVSNNFKAKLPPKQFGKAVSNIIANAVAYTDTKNIVYVYLKEQQIVIENECEPIAETDLQRIFEPFYRLEFSRSRVTGGNGLGLYIVDTLFSSMNITYSFLPMENPMGMKFTIYLK